MAYGGSTLLGSYVLFLTCATYALCSFMRRHHYLHVAAGRKLPGDSTMLAHPPRCTFPYFHFFWRQSIVTNNNHSVQGSESGFDVAHSCTKLTIVKSGYTHGEDEIERLHSRCNQLYSKKKPEATAPEDVEKLCDSKKEKYPRRTLRE